jgi:hypothetical protein
MCQESHAVGKDYQSLRDLGVAVADDGHAARAEKQDTVRLVRHSLPFQLRDIFRLLGV